MPHKDALFVTLLECYRQHSQSVQAAGIALLCVIARSFYTGAEWRKICGDVIFCPLIAVLVGSHAPEIVIYGFLIDHTLIAALIGTAGMHGVRLGAEWAAERRGVLTKQE